MRQGKALYSFIVDIIKAWCRSGFERFNQLLDFVNRDEWQIVFGFKGGSVPDLFLDTVYLVYNRLSSGLILPYCQRHTFPQFISDSEVWILSPLLRPVEGQEWLTTLITKMATMSRTNCSICSPKQ
ncbi:hypothetical protein EVAR_99052_1 [Eumeta japonica]|uniref:Uncharacterized protein n=1 Tax=Eumeta variegata TaxID=151549 RepID=A0A4C1XXQ5_EUMVA|nr:hypothetical protein EVAR_99052_1 [Eumeta japonica]